MSDAYHVRFRTVGDGPTALGEAEPFTLVVDRPAAAGGGGLGFKGGQLLYAEVERVAEIPRAIREGPPIEVTAKFVPTVA